MHTILCDLHNVRFHITVESAFEETLFFCFQDNGRFHQKA